MLSPHLLELLRAWYRVARPQGWLFPGRDPVQPMTTRQLNRASHDAANLIQVLLGHAKLDTTALYTRVATKTIQQAMSPLIKAAGDTVLRGLDLGRDSLHASLWNYLVLSLLVMGTP
jgi:integrase